MMRKRIRLFALPKMFLGGTAAATLLLAAASSSAENTVECARMTMGGGHSQAGRYVVSDSLTRSTGVAVQKGSRFTVTNVKGGVAQATAVKNWKQYK